MLKFFPKGSLKPILFVSILSVFATIFILNTESVDASPDPVSYSDTAYQAEASTSVVAPAATHTSGNLIAVLVVAVNPGTITVSDTRLNTYASASAAYALENGTTGQWFYAFANTTGQNTVTGNFSQAATGRTIRVLEYENIEGVSPVDISVSGLESVSPLFTTTAPDELILAGWEANTYVSSCLAGNGYTLLANDRCASEGIARPVEQRVVSSIQTNTLSSIGNIGGAITGGWTVSFKIAARDAATPTFSVPAGTYTAPQSVVLSSATVGATVCYTTDGSAPTTDGAGTCTGTTSTYAAAISVTSSKTIKTVATMSGGTDSYLASAAYAISGIQGPITNVSVSQQGGPGSSVSTPAVTHTIGNLIAVFVVTNLDPGTITVSDTQTNTYTPIGTPVAPISDLFGQWFYAFAGATANNIVTATFSNGNVLNYNIRALEYSGIDPTSPLDVYVTGGGATSPAFSTSEPNELILAGWHAQFDNGTDLTSCVADAGYTLNANDYCSTNIGRPVQQRIVSSLQTNATVALGHTGGAAWNNWVVSFKGAVTPAFAPIAGTYAASQDVTLTSTVPGAAICYTTDGSDPTTDGGGVCTGTTSLYATAITVASSQTIKAVATMSGMTDSVITSANYVIDPSAKITFTTSGASFSPIITVEGHPNIRWEFGDGSTSDSLSPSVTFANASVRTNTLVVTPWSAISSINIGYNHNESGTTSIPDLPQQNVTAVSGLSNAAPYLWAWVSWNNPIAALDFSNFTALTTLDCSYCESLDSINLSNTPLISRLNLEDSVLDTLDLSQTPNIADFRATDNDFTSITWPTNGEPYMWHLCAHSMDLLGPIADFSKFPALTELWIRDDAQNGTLSPVSTKMESVWAQNNQYTAADFSGNFPTVGTDGYIDIYNNLLASLDISNNPGLEAVEAYDNRLTSLDVSDATGLYRLDVHNNLFAEAAIDDILLDFDALGTSNGYLNLTDNVPSSITGQTNAADLISRGWTVLTDGNTLTLGKAGNGGTGTVTLATGTPATIFNTCGTGCTDTKATLVAGTQVILTATPDAGSTFVGWSNGCSGTQSACTVTLSANVTATATFTTEASGIHGPITQTAVHADSAWAASLSAPAVTHTEGNLIAVHLAVHENAFPFSIADTQGNVYTAIGSSTLVGGDISGQWFYAFAKTTSLNTVTATFDGTYSTLRVLEYANINRLSPVDVIVSGTGATSPTFTTDTPRELILAAWHTDALSCSAGPGYTLLPNDQCGYGAARPAEERITSSVLTNTTASLVTTGGGVSGGWTVSFRAALVPPTFSLAAGTFSSAQTVTLSTTDAGAAIHYTLDGSDPTVASPTYSSALTISSTTTVKALATQSGFSNSAIASATYTISYSSGGGGGSSSSITKPTIEKYEVTSIAGNLVTLSFSVLNASQMMLSPVSDFAGESWETYAASTTYTKAEGQDTLYIKFKSPSGGISAAVELSLIDNGTVSVPLFPNGTLIKTPDSFKVYITLEHKKKWICTPEVFEQLGYAWTDIQELTRPQLDSIPDYEDNLIRSIGDYKVYLVVNGVRRHIPNPEIFLDYGFKWEEVNDVPQETINKYRQAYLLKESRVDGIYYAANGIKKLIPTTEVFNSYGDKTEDVQTITKLEMQSYPTSHLIRLGYSPDVYLIKDDTKKRITSPEVFGRYGLDWNHVIIVNQTEFDFYQDRGMLE